MKNPIRVMIADDHSMFKEGLHLLLRHYPHLQVIGEAPDGAVLLKMIEKDVPDIVITDIQMPIMTGIEVTKVISEKYPSIKTIALTMYEDEHHVVDMMDAGAKGYLRKNATKEELANAIQVVYEGATYFCNSTSIVLSKMLAGSKINHFRKLKEVHFNENEVEIIRLICEEYASKHIAGMTKLTQRTVEKYRNQIMEKIGAKNVVGIVIYAIKNGMYKP